MKRIIECVPNFSEGRDKAVIAAIAEAIEKGGREAACEEPGVKILGTEPGEAANRTVITFAGSPEAVAEAAFRAAECAGRLIDMRKHEGVHPRSGATDVLPFVPVQGITLGECADIARRTAERIFRETGIPCYCYEAAAFRPDRKNLAVCRAGGYEALPEKIADPLRKPDFSPERFTEKAARAGACNVGARKFLIAVNFNLDTTDAAAASEIAADIREKGRPAKDPVTGEILREPDGKAKMIPGALKGCKAIGWYIAEYGIAQVSVNITDTDLAPLHRVFDEASRSAAARGLRVTGTEIIGLVPLKSLTDAGRHALSLQGRTQDITEEDAVRAATEYLGLNELRPFRPEEKVLEYAIGYQRTASME